MRVLTLVPNQKGFSPGQRGSIELWERILHPAGIELDYVPFETEKLRSIIHTKGNHFQKTLEMIAGYGKRLRLLKKIDEYDAVFIYREAALLGPAFLEKMIARKKPIIYQLDDPLYIPYKSPSNGYFSYLKFFGKIKEIIRISKVVIANSTHIRDYCLQYNKNVRQIPSIVDTEKFRFQSRDGVGKRVCVGWSGSPTTLRNIKLVEKPLQRISKNDLCDIHFIGGTDFSLKNVEYTAQSWERESEVEDLRKLDIGLVPLPDFSWNRHKFIMKTAQYMALGIVPVGTPMASNPEVINHGKNGFLASSDDQWFDCLMTLIEDETLRHDMSLQAVEDANLKYSLRANSAKILEAFRAALR